MTPGIARRRRTASALALGLAACVAAGGAAPARADEPPVERVQVAAPFIDLHTGPGRGFPIQYVAARDEWITIELRHTDWFKVHTTTNKVD